VFEESEHAIAIPSGMRRERLRVGGIADIPQRCSATDLTAELLVDQSLIGSVRGDQEYR
jgi:hypothetical protein